MRAHENRIVITTVIYGKTKQMLINISKYRMDLFFKFYLFWMIPKIKNTKI